MAHVADHLSIEDLEQRYRACEDACSARHYQTIWLLAQGHTVPEVSALTSCAALDRRAAGPLQRARAGPSVADFMADQLGLETLAQQRGWEALQAIGWLIQSNPRRGQGF